ncbi:MAG: hypothetical protein PHF63_14115, partial [Herbinix sp.]|nr:hypothetical protein [Herbinix sp.]
YHSLKENKLIPIMVIVGVLVYFTLVDSTNLEEIFKGNHGIDQMTGTLLSTTGEIILGYIIALLMCYIFLNLISDRINILTKWGDRTLPIFLFHIFVTRTIKTLNIFDGLNPIILLLLMFLICIIVISILSSDIFMNITYYMWNPYKSVKIIAKKLRMAI